MLIESDKKNKSTETVESGNVNYDNQLREVQNNINELKDSKTDNDEVAIKSLDSNLNSNFLSGIREFLNKPENLERKADLLESVKVVLNNHKNEKDFREKYKNLLDLAKTLGVEGYTEVVEGNDEKNVGLGLKGSLGDPKPLAEGQDPTGKFYKGIDQQPENEGSSKLDLAKIDIDEQLVKVQNLIGEENKSKLPEGHKLGEVKELLEKIQKIIDNPINGNVQILQKFIYDNLDDDKSRGDFKSKNKFKDGKFDGKFGISTLEGLNIVLGKTGKYVDSFKSEKTEGVENDPFKDVKIKNEIPLSEGDIKADDLIDFPELFTVNFKNGNSIDKSDSKPQEVTLVVKNGENTKDITIIVTIDVASKKIMLKEKQTGNSENTPGDNGGNGSQHGHDGEHEGVDGHKQEDPQPKPMLFEGYPRENNVTVNQLGGLVLYDSEFKGTEKPNEKVVSAVNALQTLGLRDGVAERVYLMEAGGKTLAVRLDNQNCLYPIAVDIETGRQMFLKNNPSCLQYLRNKMPASLNGNVDLAWNGNKYVIGKRNYPNWLTIEPMTIAGRWVSKDLSQCLALLNFTNYLRNEPGLDRGKFKNDNPDLKWEDDNLYVRVKKMDKEYEKNVDLNKRWMHVDLAKFGLNGVSEESDTWKDFIKYNNGEHWEDNWNKKNENKDFFGLDLLNTIQQSNVGLNGQGGGNRVGVDNQTRVVGAGGVSVVESTSTSVTSNVRINNPGQQLNSGVSGGVLDTLVVNVDSDFSKSYNIPAGAYCMKLKNGDLLYNDGNGTFFVPSERPYLKSLGNGMITELSRDPSKINLKSTELNVCTVGAEKMSNEFVKINKEIDSSKSFDGKVKVLDGKYVLEWGDDKDGKSIPLSGADFVKNGKIFGFEISEPEKWMKVVCYAYENYDTIIANGAKSPLINETYGIDKNNESLVVEWLNGLKSDGNDSGNGVNSPKEVPSS